MLSTPIRNCLPTPLLRLQAMYITLTGPVQIAHRAMYSIGLNSKHAFLGRPVARGGVGGVPTPPFEINDIHNPNYLIQERPFDCF